MKRILILLLAALLLTSAALAEAPRYSPEMTALALANTAMREKYGFTWRTLGLFTVEIELTDQAAHVNYRTCLLPASRIGEYDVTIVDGKAEVAWTHDGQDAALWQSGDPESPCWGASQIVAYLAQGGIERHKWLQPWFAEGEESTDPPSIYDELGCTIAPWADSDLPVQQVREIADAALMDVYAMTVEEVASLDHAVDSVVLVCADGTRLWRLTYSDYESCFYILLHAATGEVFHITHLAGGNG